MYIPEYTIEKAHSNYFIPETVCEKKNQKSSFIAMAIALATNPSLMQISDENEIEF